MGIMDISEPSLQNSVWALGEPGKGLRSGPWEAEGAGRGGGEGQPEQPLSGRLDLVGKGRFGVRGGACA